MSNLTKEILRWIAIVFFGGLGLLWASFGFYMLFAFNSHNKWLDSPAYLLFMLAPLVIITVPCLSVAHICIRREYHSLYRAAGLIGAIVTFYFSIQVIRYYDLLNIPFPLEQDPSILALLVNIIIPSSPFLLTYLVYRAFADLARRSFSLTNPPSPSLEAPSIPMDEPISLDDAPFHLPGRLHPFRYLAQPRIFRKRPPSRCVHAFRRYSMGTRGRCRG